VLSAHNDYTEWSGPQRVRELLPQEAENLLQKRFAIIQVWRAINQPIRSNPLALADARSVATEDLLVSERRYPTASARPIGCDTTRPTAGSISRDAARRGDRLQGVRLGERRPRALHAAHLVRRPADPPGAPPRQSIEARTLAFF